MQGPECLYYPQMGRRFDVFAYGEMLLTLVCEGCPEEIKESNAFVFVLLQID